jgi:hypothetical protein
VAGHGELRQADLVRGLETVGGEEVKQRLQLALLKGVGRLPEVSLLAAVRQVWHPAQRRTCQAGR